MASGLFVIGINWRTATVEMRERLAFADNEVGDALNDITYGAVDEALLISTCNRVEIYGATSARAPASALSVATAQVRDFLARSRGVPSEELNEALYERVDADAVSHVFRVAAALDSMVVGEAQILGQLKSAYGTATRLNTAGPVLRKCMERSFTVAKRVRSETAIAEGAANVSSVAVELAGRVFGELTGKSVLLVGAGKMSALAARHLRRAGAASIRVVNRSLERAQELATKVEGEARSWDQLEKQVAGADVVISSTGAREPVLTKSLLKKAMKARRYKSIVLIDIAVPRDIDPAVAKVDGVYLFDIDDLRKVVEKNLKHRSKEAMDAHRIVQGEVLEFQRWLRSQRVVPTIRSLREHFHEIARSEADRAARAVGKAKTEQEQQRAVRRLAEIIVNKLLHLPLSVLKEEDREAEALVQAAEKLFKLSTSEAESAQTSGPAPIHTDAPAKPRGS